MELEINGKMYQFKFGIGFAKDINTTMKAKDSGVSVDIGLRMAILGIMQHDALALEKVLDMANKGQNPRITPKELDNFIDTCDNIDDIFKQVNDFFESSNATKGLVLDIQMEIKRQMEKEREK